jgi:hypothetical protein
MTMARKKSKFFMAVGGLNSGVPEMHADIVCDFPCDDERMRRCLEEAFWEYFGRDPQLHGYRRALDGLQVVRAE